MSRYHRVKRSDDDDDDEDNDDDDDDDDEEAAAADDDDDKSVLYDPFTTPPSDPSSTSPGPFAAANIRNICNTFLRAVPRERGGRRTCV